MIRRVIGTTLAGLCALTGPLAGTSFAATGPTLNLSGLSTSGTARPGVAFTVSPASGCPADSGVQSVDLSFTDAAAVSHSIGTAETADDGSWDPVTVMLPVAGLDEDGAWSDTPVAAGAGTVEATCSTGDAADDSDGSTDPGDDTTDPEDDTTDPGDDTTDPEDGTTDPDAAVITQTYTPVALTVAGSAPKLTLSASVIKPGESVTVTPAEGCATGGVSTVAISVVSLAPVADDSEGNSDDNTGDDQSGDDPSDSTDPSDGPADLVSTSVTTSAGGTWTPTTLLLPADADTGDYAVTADCSSGDGATSSYDAAPLALGTVVISPATCGARSVYASLSGSYSGIIVGKDDDLTLPTRLALTGDGPWKVKVRSATTGQVLTARTVACAKPQYELDVPKSGLSGSNRVRARVCNTGRAPVSGILQVMGDKKYQKADKETLDAGDCTWLIGPKVDKGDQVKAQVLLDAPGKASDDVVESFTVKRAKH